MAKVTHEVRNGTKTLVLSETVLFNTSENVSFEIPSAPSQFGTFSTIQIVVTLKYDAAGQRVFYEIVDRVLYVDIYNSFHLTTGQGNIEPYFFHVGPQMFYLYFGIIGVTAKTAQLTLTIYKA